MVKVKKSYLIEKRYLHEKDENSVFLFSNKYGLAGIGMQTVAYVIHSDGKEIMIFKIVRLQNS